MSMVVCLMRSVVTPSKLVVPSGRVQRDPSAGVQLQGPAAFVDEVMVELADRHEVVEIGRPEVFPERDVMDPAVFEPDGAARHATGPVHRPQRPPLGPGRQSALAADSEHLVIAAQPDGHDRAVATQPADHLDR